MDCGSRNGQALAAADALSVSEAELQRIKQQGCGVTRSDRNVMRMPDLKALMYPVPTNAPVDVSGHNNMFLGRSSVHAEGFTPPFVNDALDDGGATAPTPISFAQRAPAGSSAVPGLDFAGTGMVAQLDDVMLGNPQVFYKQIAASISGQPLPTSLPTVDAREAPVTLEAASADAPLTLEAVGAEAQERSLYGSGNGNDSFWKRCDTACRGFLYDILHLSEVRKVYGASGNVDALRIATTRDSRLPYLVFIMLLVALAVAVLWLLSSRQTPTYTIYHAPPCGWPPGVC